MAHLDYSIAPFTLEQAGFKVRLDPSLANPYALGLWLAEQPARTQALMLAGWLQGLEEPQATAMLRMVNVGRLLRETAAPLSGATAALEHLLNTTRVTPLDGVPLTHNGAPFFVPKVGDDA